jgi:hypothetical protein
MTQGTEDTVHAGPGEVHRRIVEQFLEGQLEDALALIDPEVIDHRGGTEGDHRGRNAWRQKWELISAGSPFHDVSVTIEQNIVSGDTSVNRYTVRGTHTASGHRRALGPAGRGRDAQPVGPVKAHPARQRRLAGTG